MGAKKGYLKIRDNLFYQYLKFQKPLFKPISPKKILFSNQKPDWEEEINKGFKNSKHEVFFDEITSDNLMKYDLAVPLTIDELKSKEIRELLDNNPISIPSLESILLCDDKYQFNKTLIAKGFGEFIPKMEDPHTYPYIFKKKIDQYGANTHIIYGNEEEEKFSEILSSTEYFSQEIITGKNEYATHILFENKKIVHSLNIKYIFTTDIGIKGKDKSHQTICRCPYLDIFTSILESIGFEGLCCFNYKVRNNIPYIIEINPRFGGSLTPYFSLFINHI
ncbi:MAG: ATP-grasp domain-containing protein [Cyclobacteriaceae bacterium]|nr:ATP-grasp domain-containing protein [Cyclobacteriaceae bacterium]